MNRPVLEESGRAIRRPRRSAGAGAAVAGGLVDLSSTKAEVVLDELGGASDEGTDESVAVFDCPAMP